MSICPVQAARPGEGGWAGEVWRLGLQSCSGEATGRGFSGPGQVSTSLRVPVPPVTQTQLPGAGRLPRWGPRTALPTAPPRTALSSRGATSGHRVSPLGRDHGVCSQASECAGAVLPQSVPGAEKSASVSAKEGRGGQASRRPCHGARGTWASGHCSLLAGGGARRAASSGSGSL